MNGEPLTDAPLLDVWVDRTLNLGEDSSPEEKQREIFKRLEDVQYHPGFYEASAIQAYFDQELSPIAKWQSCARLLRDDIAEFRRQFFQMEVSARVSRFEKLHADAEYFPVLKLQIAHLKPGLELNADQIASLSDKARRLAHFLMENHVAEPSQKPAKRREFQNTQGYETSVWKNVIRELESKAPAVAGLDRPWLRAMSRPAKAKNKLSKAKPLATTAESSSSSGRWVYALVGMFIFRAIFSIARYNTSDTSSRYVYTPPSTQDSSVDFSPENIQDILNSIHENTPPSTSPDIVLPNVEERELSDIAQLSVLKEYEFLRFESNLFKVVKERGELFIVFDERRYLSEIEIVSKLSSSGNSRLFQNRIADLEEFQRVAALIRELQETVYVTYPGANASRYHPVPAGVVLKPMLGDSPIQTSPLGTDSLIDDDWQQAYRYRFSPAGDNENE